MDIASLVLGIVSIIFSVFCGCISIITAPIGLVLGIIDLSRKKDKDVPKGMAISGIVLSIISLAILLIIFVIILVTGYSY
ncbi:hypothetical protein JCM1393_05580 [Clostridium carnis]